MPPSVRTLGLCSLLAAVCVGPAVAADLGLDEYLLQVRRGHAGVQAAELGRDAAEASLRERDRLTSPYLFALTQKAEDRSTQLLPVLYGDRNGQNAFALGFEQRTAFGLNLRLAHRTTFIWVRGLTPLPAPFDAVLSTPENYYTARNTLELNQDLWRNFFGAELSASADALEAKARAEREARSFEVLRVLVEAEACYWRLAQARRAVRIHQDLVERARRQSAWTEGRVRLKLMDTGDLLQSRSQEQARALALAGAEDQLKVAERAFNLLRGSEQNEVPETLAEVALAPDEAPAWPDPAPERGDLKALRAAAVAARAQASVQDQGSLPELQAGLSAALNGLDPDWSPAWTEAWRTQHVAYAATLTLRLPLDSFTTRATLRDGYRKEAEARDRELAQRTLEARSQWAELTRRFAELQERLKAARALERLQQQKAEYERSRLRTGNSVTFQVLQFEQDWGQSQLARLEIECALRELLAQRKLYAE